jgi:hypothetical protein
MEQSLRARAAPDGHSPLTVRRVGFLVGRTDQSVQSPVSLEFTAANQYSCQHRHPAVNVRFRPLVDRSESPQSEQRGMLGLRDPRGRRQTFPDGKACLEEMDAERRGWRATLIATKKAALVGGLFCPDLAIAASPSGRYTPAQYAIALIDRALAATRAMIHAVIRAALALGAPGESATVNWRTLEDAGCCTRRRTRGNLCRALCALVR